MSNRQESVPGAKANRYEDILKAHSTTSSSADQSRSASDSSRLGPMTVPFERNVSNGSLARDVRLDNSDDEATTETLIKPFGQATGGIEGQNPSISNWAVEVERLRQISMDGMISPRESPMVASW
eukprot:CAMPEP_0198210462 /NCGR_PEP_ID=MMETSP1445-20131203/20122_1 /TAXON_ID=36898 /ORGANISM="Pyramimonas sp., Strain CCMP2087" /LENGTH=124 /DNA_ID=CAMNT_0043884527 /DNA_START=318 /DNA_END=689 /DNA_ORIENTATION=-